LISHPQICTCPIYPQSFLPMRVLQGQLKRRLRDLSMTPSCSRLHSLVKIYCYRTSDTTLPLFALTVSFPLVSPLHLDLLPNPHITRELSQRIVFSCLGPYPLLPISPVLGAGNCEVSGSLNVLRRDTPGTSWPPYLHLPLPPFGFCLILV